MRPFSSLRTSADYLLRHCEPAQTTSFVIANQRRTYPPFRHCEPAPHLPPFSSLRTSAHAGVAISDVVDRSSSSKAKIPTALRPQACTERNRRRRLLARSSDIGHCLGMTRKGSLRTSAHAGVAIFSLLRPGRIAAPGNENVLHHFRRNGRRNGKKRLKI